MYVKIALSDWSTSTRVSGDGVVSSKVKWNSQYKPKAIIEWEVNIIELLGRSIEMGGIGKRNGRAGGNDGGLDRV